MAWALLAAVVALSGCSDDAMVVDGGTPDSGVAPDANTAPVDIPWLADGVPPVMLSPCPDGWREVTDGRVTECDPYPEDGADTCAAGDAHFPGEAGCRPIGEACPAGDYATTLPTAGPVVYVNADAPAGGDGSLGSPYDGLGRVGWSSLAAGTTVAVAKGTYEGTLPLRAGVSVVGACVAETVLTGVSAPVTSVVSVANGGEPAEVRNLAISGAAQYGAAVEDGRALSLDGVLIERTSTFGLLAYGRGAVVTLRDTVVRDVQPEPGDRQFGRGINLQDGAHLDGSRVIVARNHEAGIGISNPGTTATLTDTVVRGTLPRANDRQFGRGITVRDGAQIDGARMLVVANHDIGIAISEEDARMTLTDAVVRGTLPAVIDGERGRGINLQTGARLDATRLLVVENHQVGIFAAPDGTALTLTDTVIRDTLPARGSDPGGDGIIAMAGCHFDAVRLLVTDNHEAGVVIDGDGTTVTLSDALVDDSQPRSDANPWGLGVVVQHGATMTAARLAIDRSWTLGLAAVAGGVIDAQDISVVDIQRASCASTTCRDRADGYAAAATGGTLRLTRFQFVNAATCALIISPYQTTGEQPSVDLDMGIVSGSDVGVCIQAEAYDLSRLMNDVLYRDNMTNLDTTSLPIPDPVNTIAP